MAPANTTRFYGGVGIGLRRKRLLSRRGKRDLHFRQMKSGIRQIGVLVSLAVCVYAQTNTPKPAPPPARWLGLIGEYGPDSDILYILEKDGKLSASFKRAEAEPLQEISRNIFAFSNVGPRANQRLVFTRDRSGHAIRIKLN